MSPLGLVPPGGINFSLSLSIIAGNKPYRVLQRPPANQSACRRRRCLGCQYADMHVEQSKATQLKTDLKALVGATNIVLQAEFYDLPKEFQHANLLSPLEAPQA